MAIRYGGDIAKLSLGAYAKATNGDIAISCSLDMA